jgi:photosystem II stability/assembly factor-like uncharacterized protein
MTIGLIHTLCDGQWPPLVIQGLMALSSMRRRLPRILIAGLSALLTAGPAAPADAGVNTWTSARLYGGTVYGLAASPANPSIVLAGTGGAGVFRSTDGGVSWHRSSSGMPHDTIVFTFAFAPSAPNTVFAATYASGVYRSTDAGRTWVRITSSIDDATFFYIAVDPSNAARLFIGSAAGVWRSTDSGATWMLLTWPPSDNIAGEALAIAPSDPQVVYIVGPSMLRSADGGTTWTNMDPVTEAASVWVDPSDANTLLVGGLDGVYRSTDGGASWQPVATVAANDVVFGLVPDPAVPHRFWAGTYAAGLFRSDDGGSTWHSYSTGLPAKRWVRGITFSSAGALCAVTQFGVFRRAQTASSWTPSSSGITGSQVNSLAYAPSNSAVLYAGLQGQGLFRSTDNGTSWSYAGLRGQNVNSVAVSPTRASTIWAATLTGVRRSRDGGVTWVKQFAVPDDAPTAVAVATSSPSTLYVTTYQSGVYRSTDGGLTWHRLTLPGYVVAFCILIDPGNASRIWVGTRFDGIVRSTDGGATWTSGQGSQPSGYDAVSLAIDPHNHKRLFAAIEADSGGGVYVSSDSGSSWSRSTGGTAPESADVVAADPSTAGRIYAGDDDPAALGVYRSDDDGVSWRNISAGLITRTPLSLTVQPAGIIHLGTTAYGRNSGGGIFNYTPTR